MRDTSAAGATELGYVRFGVSDLIKWQEYLGDLLGLEVLDDPDAGKLWGRMDDWHHRLCFERNDADDMLSMGLRVAGPEEFHDMQATLTAASIPIEIGSKELELERAVLEIMTVSDPSGIEVEIFHGPQLLPHMPFYPARRRFGKFVTGASGVGHLLIRHGGIKKTYEFYKLLGLRSASEFRVPLPDAPEPMSGKFMHCNVPGAREHTIAFGLPSEKACNHLMMEVDNLDDLMVSYFAIKEAGYPMIIDLGRHANDQSFSFYAMTPSGFAIEIAHGCGPISAQSYLLNDDYYGHAPNPDLPAHMGEVDEIRK